MRAVRRFGGEEGRRHHPFPQDTTRNSGGGDHERRRPRARAAAQPQATQAASCYREKFCGVRKARQTQLTLTFC